MIKHESTASLALAGLRVLEIGSGAALAYAGKLFSDFGAEVIKVEDWEGDALRSFPPLLANSDREQQSALNAWLNTNKRSVTLGSNHVEEHAWLSRLAKTCDVVLDARALREGIDVLRRPVYGTRDAANTQNVPIEVCLTWFGETGPYSHYVGAPAVCRALAGAVYGSGAVEGPPHLPHDIQTGIVAGLAAFSSAISALLGESDGSRRYVLSIHELAFSVVEMEVGMVQDGRHPKARLGVNRFCTTHPGGIYKAREGWIGIFAHTGPQWAALCAAIGYPEHADDPRFESGPTRIRHADEIDAFLTPALLTRTATEWFEELAKVKFPAVLVPTMDELLVQSVHRERGAFVPVQSGTNQFEGVVVPFPLGDAGPLPGGAAPLKGADNPFYRSEDALAPRVRRACATEMKPPLRKIRVIDLTMGWAGPLAARTLADFGAEVIKVEGAQYPDWWRGTHYTDAFYKERLYEKNSNFALMNRNKLGITLDLTRQEGRAVLLELVKTADLVIENYSTEVLPKLGLDYTALTKVNERLVMVSMPAFGAGNDWSGTRAYGGTLEQASGLPHHTGFAQNPPSLTSYAYGDPVGGWNGGAAALLSLFVQARTGKGRHINLSQVECMLPMVAPFIIEQSVCGQTIPRQGNAHPVFAPHGVYQCAGSDEWVVLSITSDTQWQALVNLIEARQLSADVTLNQVEGRRLRKQEIDAQINRWSRQRSADRAMGELQQAGIAAGVVNPVWRVLDDPHLNEREFFKTIPRAYLGKYRATTPWFRETSAATEMVRPAPTLGEHNLEVFDRILGMTKEQQQALENCGITGTEATRKADRQ
ncbi:CaiB/BaiF CoA-transferase family protein [Advenella mimigardefordensis]|uniref:Formyl-coenzyme A transferase n=1 Tax=Advenella mimigardefordensis (strain DSM 17166 / LMG 22922 / DPN7) TaxID=1247726 RepID=W0PB77_ADVMD|nr:CoA transferase [Advenella mimigardefordensis]AHG62727.1 formyl-coenzyme A transferase [Advenella mimigardefordensis DPN7]